jgi:hypothetical protein
MLKQKSKFTRGRCRYCRCSYETPCINTRTGEACAWADLARTVCSSEKCVLKGKRDGLALFGRFL